MLKAFSSGCSALTGVEAIATGVPLFKPPRVERAKRTELMLGVILAVMLLGLAILDRRWHVGPRSGQTVLSEIMADAVGRHWAYFLMSITITVVLALAANTSFGGLPVLASLLGYDNYLPHLFSLRGGRQVFTYGIVTLAVLAAALLIAVDGTTQSLIPMFAIGSSLVSPSRREAWCCTGAGRALEDGSFVQRSTSSGSASPLSPLRSS